MSTSDAKSDRVSAQLEVLLLISDPNDRYGIGSMCSQWTAAEVAEDIAEHLGIGDEFKQASSQGAND